MANNNKIFIFEIMTVLPVFISHKTIRFFSNNVLQIVNLSRVNTMLYKS